MINLVRKIVAGPKNRTVDQQFDLDLTYITPNIIAMAFPATGLEKAYRNSIDDVAKFLKTKHGKQHYLVLNASNRKYDYEPFDHQVMEFFWTDHQAPPITTMFEMSEYIYRFLKQNQKNVVAVHCNHGKGRTGTAIIAYLLYSGQYDDVKQALVFYNTRRFKQNKLAIDQPCQLRYLNYFKTILELPLEYLKVPLKAFKLVNINQKGMKQNNLFVRISQTRTQHIIYPSVFLSQTDIKFMRPLIGDIFIELMQCTWTGEKQLLRINFHLFFLEKNADKKIFEVKFFGEQIKMNQSSQDFQFTLEFQQFCSCHQTKRKKKQCMCLKKREREQAYWDNMIKFIQNNRLRSSSHLKVERKIEFTQTHETKLTQPEYIDDSQFQQL